MQPGWRERCAVRHVSRWGIACDSRTSFRHCLPDAERFEMSSTREPAPNCGKGEGAAECFQLRDWIEVVHA